LIPDPTGDNAGVVVGDDVSLGGSVAGDFVSADASDSVTVTVSGKSLAGTKSGNYVLNHPSTVSAAIIKRKLTVTNLTPINKEYDGTRTATVNGTASITALLIADGGNADGGVVSTDAGQVSLTGTAAYEFSSKDVGTSRTITMSGRSLTGSRSHNYTLHTPPGLAANITKRPLKFVVGSDKSKFVGQDDPSFSFSLDGTTSYASGESATTIGGLSLSRAPGTAPGAYSVTVTTGPLGDSTPKNNYNITVVDKTLYIARATITTTKVDGIVTLPGVTCSCEGFKPGATVTLKMYSTPTTLDTAIVQPDGTCPDLAGSIPAGTEGDHTLEITSDFPNDDPLLYSEPISLSASAPTPSPTPTPSSTPTTSSTPTPSPSATTDPATPASTDQKLSVFVWLDLNGNGVKDSDEPDLPGVTLQLSQAQVLASAITTTLVSFASAIAGPASGTFFAASLSTALTDASGFLFLDSVTQGNWVIRAILPSKLNITQDSDSVADGQIVASVTAGSTVNTWMGVRGNAAIASPIYDSNNRPTNQEVQVLWEGMDEKLMTADDIFLVRDPKSGVIQFTGLPAGKYRLIRLGATKANSECVDIVLSENRTFTANIITQKSAVCFTSAVSIRSSLATTGNSVGLEVWVPISMLLFAAGTSMMLLSNPRRRRQARR
jgi:hypothetical protein